MNFVDSLRAHFLRSNNVGRSVWTSGENPADSLDAVLFSNREGSTVSYGLAITFLSLFACAALGAPQYVQSNYAVPGTPQTTVTLPYTSAQSLGDFNVVVVGWNDSTAQVASVSDSLGNVYQLAVGPMATGAVSQAIFYAKNIAAGTNAVTVTFNAAANYPDIRVLEYSGIDPVNPVDSVIGATGNSAICGTGALITSNAADLLVAANTVRTFTSNADSGFTKRLLTNPDGDLAEDRVVGTTGSYSASPSLSSAGDWVIQMVAFRAAGGSPTPTPTPTPTPATVAYVQGNYAVPSTPQTEVTLPYTLPQVRGDLNVIVVGWADSTAQVNSLKDSMGNVYQIAVGPTVLKRSRSQAIYYAKNISAAAASANAVTVTFNGAANYPDIRILEYSGIDQVSPLHASVGATGNSSTSSSGTLTSTGSDLLVCANTVQTFTTGADSGYTQRLLTRPNGDIAEDRVVMVAGPYSGSPPLAAPGDWVAQLAAFRVAGSLSATPTPTIVALAWNANTPTSDPGTNTVGYKLYTGRSSGNYTQSFDVGSATSTTLSNLASGSTYFYVVTGYNAAGVESAPSNEVSYSVP
jgi:hypothetical protein